MTDIIRFGIISDTHGSVPARVFHVFDGVKRIYHCGDVGSMDCIVELEALAPVRAVSGNMDGGPTAKFPRHLAEQEDFGLVVMAHGMQFGQYNEGIIRGMLQSYAMMKPQLILFGHTHIPIIQKPPEGPLVINPGSASHPRGGHAPTVVLVEFEADSQALNTELVRL